LDYKHNINYKIQNLMNDSVSYEVNYQKLLILKQGKHMTVFLQPTFLSLWLQH